MATQKPLFLEERPSLCHDFNKNMQKNYLHLLLGPIPTFWYTFMNFPTFYVPVVYGSNWHALVEKTVKWPFLAFGVAFCKFSLLWLIKHINAYNIHIGQNLIAPLSHPKPCCANEGGKQSAPGEALYLITSCYLPDDIFS